MGTPSQNRTQVSDQSQTFNPGHQLPGQRPFAVQAQADTKASVTSESDHARIQQLDAGVLKTLGVQAKLAIGAPDDQYEQEADRVASQVVEQINAPQAQLSSVQSPGMEKEELMMKPLADSIQRQATPQEEEEELMMKPLADSIQRQAAPQEEEEELMMKPLAGSIQRQGNLEENKKLQSKPAIQKSSEQGGVASDNLETSIEAARGQGRPLGNEVRASMEHAFGNDFGAVRVHTDARSNQLNQSIQARAFTTGQDIFFRQGEYRPESPDGQGLLAHELTHVVQQNGTAQLQGKQRYAQPGQLQQMGTQSQVLNYLQGLRSHSGAGSNSLYRKEIAAFQAAYSHEQIMGKQQQLLPTQARNISQTGDQSKTIRACGNSSDAGEITHKTKFNAPDGSPRTRTTVGVGEEVEFEAPTAGKWTASAGSPVTLANGNKFNWTAPNRAASVDIKLEADGKESSVSMQVIEPSSITATKKSNMGYPAGRQGAGMKLTFNYHPMSVSFGNVEAKEVSGPATNISGYFADNYTPADLWHDSGDTFFPIGEDNKDTATDTAAFSGYPRPWAKGGWDWQIPNHFKVKTEGGDGKRFTTVTQAFSLKADGESTVEKAGASVTRNP